MSKQHRRFSLVPVTFSSWIKRTGKTTSSPAVLPQAPGPHPAAADRNAWHAYWQAHGQSWRTEPEIDPKRQAELDQHRAIVPDTEKGIYPFKGMKLSRADVEWLLATHENGRGPIDWSIVSQRTRRGVDLRGADLCRVDLRRLPLARTLGSLTWDEWSDATQEQRSSAAVVMEGADLSDAQLNRAFLREANLKETKLFRTQLREAYLRGAHLEGADLSRAQLEGAYLIGARLNGAKLQGAQLEGADLENITLNDEKRIGPWLVDTRWDGVNLAVVKWALVKMLGDEHEARQKKRNGKVKDNVTRLEEYEKAVRANRQLAVKLQEQGLNEDAVRFAYRAQVLQKTVFRLQMLQPSISSRQRMRSLGAWLFSWFLFLLAGYGYRPTRSFLAYFLVISGFATAYYFLGHTVGPTLSPLGAFVFSMTSFHGRGFFPGNNISLDDPLTVLAAFEALVGLIIEVTFIATLTQRFFNR